MIYEVSIDGKNYQVEVARTGNAFFCRLQSLDGAKDAHEFSVDAIRAERDVLSLVIAGKSYEVKRELYPGGMNIAVGPNRFAADLRDPRSLRSRRARADAADGPKRLSAPRPGNVVPLLVAEHPQ